MVDTAEFEWVRCACSAVFKRAEGVSGAVIDAAGEQAAPDQYDSAYFSLYDRRRRRRVAKSRRQILDALEVACAGRFLDVGCSLGYALEAARSLGLDAAGVDVSEHAAETCRRRGFEAHRASLEALPFEDASFAVVTLKHVFEHTPQPRTALAELHRVMIPGAAVLFAVPNVDYFRGVRRPQTSRFFRGQAARDHFVYYSPQTLARLLRKEGFVVASVHPRLLHRRAGALRWLVEAALVPLRIPLRAAAAALGLRKEFWLVAIRP